MTEIYEEKNVNTGVSPSDSRDRTEGVEGFTEEARRKGKGFLDEQKRTAAESLERIAEVLHDTHSRLEWEQPSAARLFGQGADALDRAAGSLRRHDVEELFRQAQELARREPALMLGGAVAAGFVMTRMFKSTSQRSEADYGSGEFLGKARESTERARESAQALFEGEEEREESRIIVSPTEERQQEASQTTLLTDEEESHARK